MSSLAPEDLFKTMLISLSSTLKAEIIRLNQMKVEVPDINTINFIISTIKTIPSKSIIEKFIEKSFKDGQGNPVEFWKKVKDRNEIELLNGISNIFGNLPNINHFNKLIQENDENGKPFVSSEIKIKVFKFVDSMIKSSIKYIHLSRKNQIDSFSYVDLDVYSKLFDLKF